MTRSPKELLQRSDPAAGRPYMPGYNILDATSGQGLLPWTWATERLTTAHNYWLATTRPDGLPHAMPVWGVWLGDGLYFSTGKRSRKARNMAVNPNCVVTTERADEAVILEGAVELVADPARLRPFYETYKAKYDWDMEAMGEPVYVVHPRVVFAFTEKDLVGSATRWTFDEI